MNSIKICIPKIKFLETSLTHKKMFTLNKELDPIVEVSGLKHNLLPKHHSMIWVNFATPLPKRETTTSGN